MTQYSSQDRDALKQKFIAERGYWNSVWQDTIDSDANFFEAYLNLSSHPWRNGVLPPKFKEFIYIAIDASTTHMYRPGLRVHVQNALGHGATRAEIMEVLQLTAILGLQSTTVGVPVLMREMAALGMPEVPAQPLSEAQVQLKTEFVERLGYWDEAVEKTLRFSPGFFKACLDFSSAPWKSGTIERKYRELIYVGINAAVTHLREEPLAIHVRNALQAGATPHEVMEVFELVSVLGIHCCTMGVGVLMEELKAAEV